MEYLALDLGGTFVKYALMDEECSILEKGKIPAVSGNQETDEHLYASLDPVVGKYKGRISGIAVSMPGMINVHTGYAATAGSFPFLAGRNIRKELENRYRLPASTENDGKCAAVAEKKMGALKNVENGAVVVLGTAVGGGLILNGKLYRGKDFSAGEYSFVVTDDGDLTTFGSYWAAVSGKEGLARAIAVETGDDYHTLDGFSIFQRANQGEKAVLKGLKHYTDRLAIRLYNLQIILDLDLIAVGGGISREPLLLEYLRNSIAEIRKKNPNQEDNPFIPYPEVTACRFGNDANLIGALCIFLEQEKAGGSL